MTPKTYPRFIGSDEESSFEVDKEGGGGGGGAITHPFQLTEVTGGANPAIIARYGTCMDVVPTNVDETFDTLTDNMTNVICLEVTVATDGSFVSATMISEDTTQPADTDTEAYITLGTVVLASGVITEINQACTHSLRFATCGREFTGEVVDVRGTYEFWGF